MSAVMSGPNSAPGPGDPLGYYYIDCRPCLVSAAFTERADAELYRDTHNMAKHGPPHAAEVTGPDGGKYTAWCSTHEDGVRTPTKARAIRWATGHNDSRHTQTG